MVYIFVHDTPSPHRFSLGSPFLAHFFFKHRPHNTYTRCEHEYARVMRTRAGEALVSSELLAIRIQMIGRLHFYKGEREARFTPLSSFPSSPSYPSHEPPPRSLAIAIPFRRLWISARSTFEITFVPVSISVYVDFLLFSQQLQRERQRERERGGERERECV